MEHDPFGFLFGMHNVEVDEQPDVLSCEFQIRQRLGSVPRQQSLNGFDVDGSRTLICFHAPLCLSAPSVVSIPKARIGTGSADVLTA